PKPSTNSYECAIPKVLRRPVESALGPPVKPGDDSEVGAARPRPSSRLLLHVLDAGKIDALGAFPGVAEIEFVLGEKHRIAVDVVGDAGAVGRYEGLELRAVVGRYPARQLKLAGLEFDRQRVFGIQPRLQHIELQR